MNVENAMRKFRRILLVIIVLSVAYLAVDSFYISLRSLNIASIDIESEKIPKSFNDSKILIFSDVYSDTTNLGSLKKHVDTHNPDLIIFLGNLLNDESIVNTELEATFKELKAPLGKYAILSLDDYAQNEVVRKLLNEADFRIIDTGLIPIHHYTEESINLVMYGAVDNNDARRDVTKNSNPNTYTLGLIHDPSVISTLEVSNIDTWVAGKTNLGKINIPIYGSIIYNDEPTQGVQLINNTPLYLSSGIGTDNPKIRLGSRPNIIILNLKSSI